MTAHPQKLQTQAEQDLFTTLDVLSLSGPRADAAARLRENGLPHRRVEEWKYTDVRALQKTFPALANQSGDAGEFDPFIDADLVLRVIDGVPQEISGDLPNGVAVEIAKAAGFDAYHAKPNANVDMNWALAEQGFAISFSKTDDRPVVLIEHEITAPLTAAHRHSVSIDAGSEAVLVERFSGVADTDYVASAGASVLVAEGAKLHHIRLVEEADGASHFGAVAGRIASDATYEPFVMTLGSHLVRTDVQISFDGEHAHGGIRGATLANGREHTDLTLEVDHAVPNCTSIEQFKSVIDDEAKAVFQGKIMVTRIAQKTDAQMMSQGLLLSETSEFLNKPELEIFADDVVCAHGATCGDLDEDLLFYLLSRGVPKAEAEIMLIQAFVAETIEAIDEPAIVEALEHKLTDWLASR